MSRTVETALTWYNSKLGDGTLKVGLVVDKDEYTKSFRSRIVKAFQKLAESTETTMLPGLKERTSGATSQVMLVLKGDTNNLERVQGLLESGAEGLRIRMSGSGNTILEVAVDRFTEFGDKAIGRLATTAGNRAHRVKKLRGDGVPFRDSLKGLSNPDAVDNEHFADVENEEETVEAAAFRRLS